MNKFILFLVCFFISISITAETVYKTTNPDGSVEFTDQKLIDSEEIKIRKTSTYSTPRLPSLDSLTKKSKSAFIYALSINKPTNDSIVIGQEDVRVSVFIKPLLKKGRGHQIRYELAGRSIVSENSLEIFKDVERGTHNLTVQIVDKKGKAVSPAVSIIFHMKRFFKKP
jgi:hypothetical protein